MKKSETSHQPTFTGHRIKGSLLTKSKQLSTIKLLISLTGLVAILIIAGLSWLTHRLSSNTINSHQTQFTHLTDHQLVTASLGDNQLQLEVVTTAASIEQGLSGRQQLGVDGMLFVLPRRSQPAFWMKDMKFDLDLIWLTAGRVTEVAHQLPHPQPGTPVAELPLYHPAEPVDLVLELPAGQAEALVIEIGEQLTIAD